MKPMLYTILCLLPLMASTCKKESKDCHHDIIIINNSTDTVICAFRFTTGANPTKCLLEGDSLKPTEYIPMKLKYCWEDELSNGRTQEIYIIDPSQFNDPNVFYSCDSIEIKNLVLKKYVLTLDDLKRSNFTVTYP